MSTEQNSSGVFDFHLSVSETSKYMGVSRPTLQKWIDDPVTVLELHEISGGTRKYLHVKQVYDFIRNRNMKVPDKIADLYARYCSCE